MTGVNDQAAMIAALSKRITSLERAASRTDATLDGRVDALEAADIALDGRVDTLEAQTSLLATQVNPTGTFISGGWAVAPAGYLLMGQTIAGGAATYAALAAMYPSWVSGPDLVLPSMSNRVLMGSTSSAGVAGGAMSRTISSNNLPLHTHANSFGTATEHQGHVHYGSPASGSHGGWASTLVIGWQDTNHRHSAGPYGSLSGIVRTGSGGDLGNYGIQNGSFYGFSGVSGVGTMAYNDPKTVEIHDVQIVDVSSLFSQPAPCGQTTNRRL